MTPKKLLQFLQGNGITATLQEFEEPVRTVGTASALSGAAPKEIVKTLVVLDPAGNPYLCLVPGHRRLSLEKAALALRTRRVRLARPDEVLKATGYEAGAVPPVGHRPSLKAAMDSEVAKLQRIVAGGGSPRALISISPEDVRRVTGAEVADLTEG